MREPRAVVIGVGNPLRGDDAVGLEVARRVRESAPPGVVVLERDGEPAALLEAWEGARAVILVDAVCSGAEPGTVHRFDVSEGELPVAPGGVSSHGLGVGEAIELARVLGRLPARAVLFGIEADDTGLGAEPTSAIRGAIDEVAARVVGECS